MFVPEIGIIVVALESLFELRAFVQVVDAQGFTGAAQVLGTTTNVVSRQVARLETRLGVRLLSRTTRRVASTEEGRRLYEHAIRMLKLADEAEVAVQRTAQTLEGTIRVAIRSTTMQNGFVGDLVGLLKANPALRVQLVVSDRAIDLAAEAIDVAVRVGDLEDSSYRVHALGQVHFVPAAAPAYFDTRTEPTHPDELFAHECVRGLLRRPQTSWRLVGPGGQIVEVPITGRFECGDVRAQADAIYAGFGIGLRPSGEVAAAVQAGTLVRVLPEWRLTPLSVHALLSPQRSRNARVEAILQLLQTAIERLA